MLAFNIILKKHFKLSEFIVKFIRPYYMDDRNFNYFRKNNNYKNCILQLSEDFKEKLIGPDVSVLVTKQDVQTDKNFSHLFRRENVMKLSMLQLKDTMYLMANSKIDIVKYETVLTYMDEKCAVNIDMWNFDFCLYILDAWLIILGHKAFRRHYYSALMNLLNKKMKRCSKYNFILTLYFIGLSKRSPPFLKELVEYKMKNFISDFTDEELAIACLSLFKTSTKINSELLLKQCNLAAENLVIKNERFHLISILKFLRFTQSFDSKLINVVENYVLKEHASFNFVECTNFLAYFATKNIYCADLYKCIENHGIKLLSNDTIDMEFNKIVERMHPSERSRVKDLARFLWGMAFVGHNINKKSVDFIIELLNARLNSTEFETNLPALIDCCQSLVLLGYYPVDIIKYVLNPSFFHKMSNIDKAKPKYQLYFISRSAYIENFTDELLNTKYINNIPKDLQNDISQRTGFKELIAYLNEKLDKKYFITCYIMPHIMISGIVVVTNVKENQSNKLINSNISKLIEVGIISKSLRDILHKDKMYTCIELLDQTVCAYKSNIPLGLMKTKLRQLQILDFNVITLTPEEIHSFFKPNEQKQCSKLLNLL